MQEKKDGVRCMIRHANGKTEGSNRKGLIVSLPQTIEKAFEQLDTDCVLDGERIGDTFYAFDLLEQEGVDLRPESAQERHNSLYNLIGEREIPYLVFVERYDNNAIKAHAFKEFQKTRSEGVVFKERYSAYVPGRPASGGKQLKYKFYATATLRVIKINDKRSVGLGVYAGPGAVPSPVGNVTIPANHQIPKVGDLVEVRYLYAYLVDLCSSRLISACAPTRTKLTGSPT
jgi:bifunctional non-homologous end joining protein LigD